MKYLLYIWQLPQNILGLLVILFTAAKKEARYGLEIFVTYKYNFGVSLGNYIILGNKKFRSGKNTVFHEHGHQAQSLKYGFLYLLVVGLPSITRNIYDRLFHKDWSSTDRTKWYYSSFPEKQADELGKVERFT